MVVTQQNDQQNPINAYYLHPGENLGVVLVAPQLDKSNYHSWSWSMKRALLSKNKYKFVNGDIAKPTRDDENYEAWERCNVMVVSWITRTLTTQIAQNTVYINNAKELWEDLKERFSKSNHFRAYDLLQEINSVKQGERTITDYFINSKILCEELDSLLPLPACTCKVKCSCDVMKTMASYRDSEWVRCFLKGLGENYNIVKT